MITGASWRFLAVLNCVVCVAEWMTLPPPPITTSVRVGSGPSKLLKHDRTRLIEALAQNKTDVILLMAAREGMNQALVSDVRKLNGTVQYRDDDIDYLRVEIPTKRVQELSF